jgi:glucose-6-phosphate 1-dehydrogenase
MLQKVCWPLQNKSFRVLQKNRQTLRKKLTRIAVVFKEVPYSMFSKNGDRVTPAPNVLIFDL